MAAPNFWDNQETAQETVGRLKSVKAIVTPLTDLNSSGEDLEALIEMADEDDAIEDEVRQEIESLEKRLESLELKALLNGPYDSSGAILTIHARDGGTDANDWAEMLLRMYTSWAQKNDYEVVLTIAMTTTKPESTAPRSRFAVPWHTDTLKVKPVCIDWSESARSTPKASAKRVLPPSTCRPKSPIAWKSISKKKTYAWIPIEPAELVDNMSTKPIAQFV